MSPRSPEDRRDGEAQGQTLSAVHDASNEAAAPREANASVDQNASAETTKQVQCVETIVELDRVAIYLRGPTAFSA